MAEIACDTMHETRCTKPYGHAGECRFDRHIGNFPYQHDHRTTDSMSLTLREQRLARAVSDLVREVASVAPLAALAALGQVHGEEEFVIPDEWVAHDRKPRWDDFMSPNEAKNLRAAFGVDRG